VFAEGAVKAIKIECHARYLIIPDRYPAIPAPNGRLPATGSTTLLADSVLNGRILKMSKRSF
jgi:hypothetical protein